MKDKKLLHMSKSLTFIVIVFMIAKFYAEVTIFSTILLKFN